MSSGNQMDHNDYSVAASQNAQANFEAAASRLESALDRRDSDVKQAMGRYEADGVSEEYAHLERRWNMGGHQLREVIGFRRPRDPCPARRRRGLAHGPRAAGEQERRDNDRRDDDDHDESRQQQNHPRARAVRGLRTLKAPGRLRILGSRTGERTGHDRSVSETGAAAQSCAARRRVVRHTRSMRRGSDGAGRFYLKKYF